MGRVCVIGSINQDIVAEAARHPRPGETVLGTTLRMHPGGKGANQAVASARAGARSVLIGCVGDDPAGQELLEVIRESGVDCAAVRVVPGVPTGRGVITLAAGENSIVVIPGANASVAPDLVDKVEYAAHDVCVAQLETPIDATIHAFTRASTAGATTVFNPAPADQVPDDLLALSDILVVNAHEYATIFGGRVDDFLTADHVPESVTRRFHGALIVTRGADGAVIWDRGSRTLVPGRAAAVVDSTGAGDCFVGYLAAGLAGGTPLGQAAHRANCAAALSVTRHGAISSIPFAAEISTTL